MSNFIPKSTVLSISPKSEHDRQTHRQGDYNNPLMWALRVTVSKYISEIQMSVKKFFFYSSFLELVKMCIWVYEN